MATLKDKLKEKHSGLSPLMTNREKAESDEIMSFEALTLSAVHVVSNGDGSLFAVVVFKEIPNKFYFAGMVLTGIVLDIYKLLGAEISEVLNVEDEEITLSAASRKSPKSRQTYIDWHII